MNCIETVMRHLSARTRAVGLPDADESVRLAAIELRRRARTMAEAGWPVNVSVAVETLCRPLPVVQGARG